MLKAIEDHRLLDDVSFQLKSEMLYPQRQDKLEVKKT